MKMVKITITVRTEKDAVWTDEQYNEAKLLLQNWAAQYVEHVLPSPDDSLDDYVNDLEMSRGPVADALSKEKTTVEVKIT